jgi:hypothetical protein
MLSEYLPFPAIVYSWYQGGRAVFSCPHETAAEEYQKGSQTVVGSSNFKGVCSGAI